MEKKKIYLGIIFLNLIMTAHAEDVSDFICSKEWFPGTDEEAAMPSSTDDVQKNEPKKKNKNTKTNQQQNVPQPKMQERQLSNEPSLFSPKSEKGVFPEDNQ